jgi:hypothetical protein
MIGVFQAVNAETYFILRIQSGGQVVPELFSLIASIGGN